MLTCPSALKLHVLVHKTHNFVVLFTYFIYIYIVVKFIVSCLFFQKEPAANWDSPGKMLYVLEILRIALYFSLYGAFWLEFHKIPQFSM